MPLTLLRHTKVQYKPSFCYGDQEVALAESFESEVQSLLVNLDKPERIVSSPLERCRKLAKRVGSFFGCRVELDPRLREIHLGSWQGKDWSAITRAEIDEWVDNFMDARPHGGESVSDLCRRVRAALRDLSKESAGKLILVVTHKGVIRAALAEAEWPDPWTYNPGYGECISLPLHFVKSRARLPESESQLTE